MKKKEKIIQFTMSNYDINQILDLYEYVVNGWRIFKSQSNAPVNPEFDVGTTTLFFRLKKDLK